MSNKAMIAVLAATCALAGSADTLVFKSGSRLEGELVRIVGEEVTFKSEDVGEVKVKRDKLVSIEAKESATVQYNDRSRREGVVAMKDGKYTLNKEELDMGDVKAINPEEEAWHGSVGFSGTAARGNTVSEKATVLADLNRRWETDRLTANFGYFFAQNGTSRYNKEKTEDRIDLGCSTATAPARVSATSGLTGRSSSPPASGPSTRRSASPTSRRSTSTSRTTTVALSAMRTTPPGRPAGPGSISSPSRTTSNTCRPSTTGRIPI